MLQSLEKILMDALLSQAKPEERTYQVCVNYDGTVLYADTASGNLAFHSDKSTLFTQNYAEWLRDTLNTIRDEKGVTPSQINFYISNS